MNNGAKKNNKIFLLIILILLAIVTISFFVENNVKSYNIQDNFDIYDFVPISGTEFQSEDLVVGKKTAFVYSALSEGTALNNKDEYIITIGKVTGINNNRYEIFSFTPQEDKFILSNKYLNVFDYPQFEMKSGNSYYGSVYVGTVPLSCTSVTINNNKAQLVRQTFELNGKPADFYLYYCVVEEEQYPENVDVIVSDTDGHKYSVSTVDGGELPIISQIS